MVVYEQCRLRCANETAAARADLLLRVFVIDLRPNSDRSFRQC